MNKVLVNIDIRLTSKQLKGLIAFLHTRRIEFNIVQESDEE